VPEGEFRFRVQHSPAAVGEDKSLHSASENFDLLVRAENQANMTGLRRRQSVECEDPWAGHAEHGLSHTLGECCRFRACSQCPCERPLPDVDEIGKLALLIDEKQGPASVAKPAQAFETGQLDAEAESFRG